MNDWPSLLSRQLAAWKAAGLERRLRVAEGAGSQLTLEGREVLNFACNDYLGLSADPRVVAAARAALETQGAGATASRLLGGSRPIHAALEAELARFKGTSGALVFASGYHAALASIATLLEVAAEAEDAPPVSILDRLAHASLLDGAKLSGARLRTFKHNDLADLNRVLERETQGASRGLQQIPRALVVVESLYSMDGDVAPLAAIYAQTHAANALLLVDEAHATGVLGPGGRGVLAEVFPRALPEDVLAMGTLSKALGSQGGFLCAAAPVLETIVHAGRAFLFSTGLAPAAAAAAMEALRIAQQDEPRRASLLARAAGLRAGLAAQGWKVLGGPGPILPILVGEETEAMRLAERLLEAGVWVPAVRFPTVKKGQARLRITLSAVHGAAEVEKLLAALGTARKA